MSNYNSLKTTIDANIKQNGNQEITGQILNSVLNQMVNILGTGYQFAGIATLDPATEPGTPDAKVFYIANGKGTYEKFGGINVTEDDVVVLYWDTAWHKEATGIASQAKLSELESSINGYIKPELELGTYYPDTDSWDDNLKTRVRIKKGTYLSLKAHSIIKLSSYENAGLRIAVFENGVKISHTEWLDSDYECPIDGDYRFCIISKPETIQSSKDALANLLRIEAWNKKESEYLYNSFNTYSSRWQTNGSYAYSDFYDFRKGHKYRITISNTIPQISSDVVQLRKQKNSVGALVIGRFFKNTNTFSVDVEINDD